MIYKFKTKHGTKRKFMLTFYWGYQVNGKEDKPFIEYIENGEFDENNWDEDIIQAIGKLDIGEKYGDYGACGISHMSIYRYV